MANQPKRNAKKDEVLFAAIAQGAPVGTALAEAGYKRATAYEWRREDPDFATRWAEAQALAVERMEAEADRRAVEGVLEPVFHQGEVVGHVRKFSDTLLMFRLKALEPAKYRERYEHSGAGGSPLTVKIVRFGGEGE